MSSLLLAGAEITNPDDPQLGERHFSASVSSLFDECNMEFQLIISHTADDTVQCMMSSSSGMHAVCSRLQSSVQNGAVNERLRVQEFDRQDVSCALARLSQVATVHGLQAAERHHGALIVRSACTAVSHASWPAPRACK